MIGIFGIGIILIVILLIISIVLLWLKKKWLFIIGAIILLIGVLIWAIMFSGIFQKSINLSNEGLNQIKILSQMNKADTEKIDRNDFYRATDNNRIYVRIEDGEVTELTLPADSTDISVLTSRGINLSSTFADVTQAYGESYKELNFLEMYGFGVEYRDKENKIKLRFYFDKDDKKTKVQDIEIIAY